MNYKLVLNTCKITNFVFMYNADYSILRILTIKLKGKHALLLMQKGIGKTKFIILIRHYIFLAVNIFLIIFIAL